MSTSDMGNVVIFKAAQNVDYRIGLANIGKELVTQAFALGRTAHETCDVDEFEEGRHRLLVRDRDEWSCNRPPAGVAGVHVRNNLKAREDGTHSRPVSDAVRAS